MTRLDQPQATCGRCGYQRSSDIATCPVCGFDSMGAPGLRTIPLSGRGRLPLLVAATAGAVLLVMLTAIAGFTAGTSSRPNQMASSAPAPTAHPLELAQQQLVTPVAAEPTSIVASATLAVASAEPVAPIATSLTLTQTNASAELASLAASLDVAWAQSDWPTAISTLTRLRGLEPDNSDYRDKVYAAQVQYADVLIDNGSTAAAVEQLQRAATLDPDRGEAPARLMALTPTPVPTATLIPPTPTRVPATATPVRATATVAAKPQATCGAPVNLWGYNFCSGSARTIAAAPSNFCSYFNCIASFWNQTNGYVVQCADGTYSHSGGVRGSCSSHRGVGRTLYAP